MIHVYIGIEGIETYEVEGLPDEMEDFYLQVVIPLMRPRFRWLNQELRRAFQDLKDGTLQKYFPMLPYLNHEAMMKELDQIGATTETGFIHLLIDPQGAKEIFIEEELPPYLSYYLTTIVRYIVRDSVFLLNDDLNEAFEKFRKEVEKVKDENPTL